MPLYHYSIDIHPHYLYIAKKIDRARGLVPLREEKMYRLSIFVSLVLLNLFAYVALWHTVRILVRSLRRQCAIMRYVLALVILLNVPVIIFFYRPFDAALLGIPNELLRAFFYPSTAWLATLLFFFMLAGPLVLILAGVGGLSWPKQRKAVERVKNAGLQTAVYEKPALSRRALLMGSAGMVLPGIYGASAYGVSRNLDKLDISTEHVVPIPHLPASWEGVTIVQLSDLHVGPYIRKKELHHLVSRVNELGPDLVAITGDTLDRHLGSMPDMVQGLKNIKSSLGVFAVLGNHDIWADRQGYSSEYQGGANVVRGLASIGIRTLRNEVVHLGSGHDRLALLGLDWLTHGAGKDSNGYQQSLTKQQLHRLSAAAGPGIPRVLLAHHPDTFTDVLPHEIGLTLSGHTHGGGQIVLGSVDQVPISVAMFRFKYLSGFYQRQGCSLYVNRGFGYVGIPLRLNCPPEISRFKLTRAV